MYLGPAVGISTALAATTTGAYLWMRAGWPLQPLAAVVAGLVIGGGLGTILRRHTGPVPTHATAVTLTWLAVTLGVLTTLLAAVWPALLPPGGASDLTHHLMLVDVLDRTRHLVDGASSEAAMGEMAHYTPGLHLLIVMAGSLAGVEAYRAAYPLLAITLALKAGFICLLAYDLLARSRARLPFALAAVGLVLFAPRAYSLDGFLQAGFYAQVAAELFVVAGWWGLARWWAAPSQAWLAYAGLMGAAVFLVWPIWIGPLLLTAALTVVCARGVAWPARVQGLTWVATPCALVAMLHFVEHAAWLRIAGTSGAVPAFTPGLLGWALLALAGVGILTTRRWPEARVTLWFAAAIAAQGLALWLLARMRGAETPYMAMKMIYLAVYPTAVLGAAGLAGGLGRLRAPTPVAWAVPVVVIGIGLRAALASPLPPPLVDVDLDAAGRWARANLPPGCVDYIVDHAEQAYWLHLAVMGQKRAAPRTADIDGYTTNRAVGRWLAGTAPRYAIARQELLPADAMRGASVVFDARTAVVLERAGAACPSASDD